MRLIVEQNQRRLHPSRFQRFVESLGLVYRNERVCRAMKDEKWRGLLVYGDDGRPFAVKSGRLLGHLAEEGFQELKALRSDTGRGCRHGKIGRSVQIDHALHAAAVAG